MMKLKFDKMHGAGNDYIYVDARHLKLTDPQAMAIAMSDRHFGVGSDGLVLIMNSEIADVRMRMFNADGSEAGMCGNASRCVGKYVYEKGIFKQKDIKLETLSGIKVLHLNIENDLVKEVTVDMGEPVFEAGKIPVCSETPQSVYISVDGFSGDFTCVSMGNPHAVVFVDNVDDCEIEKWGKAIENHPLFPEKCNVEFAQMISSRTIRMRVWERGSGETLACGTGACATLVAAVLKKQCNREAAIVLRGGEVNVKWNEDNHVTLTGGADWVFNGEY